jgi:hypothetical protein
LPGLNLGETSTHAGVFIQYKTVGSVINPGIWGTLNGLGRTLTHESGHFLGLKHIWGDSICGDDYCSDTPPQFEPTSGCPSVGTLNYCIPLVAKMFENYMDYTSDSCKNTFTQDQKTRMQTVMANSPRRASLGTSTVCIPCTDQFESNNTIATATNVFASPLNSSSSNYTVNGNIGYVDDVDWYKVNVGACGSLTINLSNLPYNYDIELYNADGSAFLQGSYQISITNDQITFAFTGSRTVNVKVYSVTPTNYTTAYCYNLQFFWTPCSVCPVPSNDVLSNAIQLTPASTCNYLSGTTCGATASGLSKPSCDAFTGTPSMKDVWYKFTTSYSYSPTGSYAVRVKGSSGFDPVVALYRSNSQENGCSDNGGGVGGVENITVGLTSPETSYIRIYNYGSTDPTTKTFEVCVIANPAQYNISTSSNPTNGGTTSGGGTYPPTYPSGNPVTVTATPNAGKSFVNWTESGNNVTTNSSYSFNITGNRNLVANFTTCSYTLNSTSINPTATGGAGGFWVYTNSDCSWSASTNGCSWITISNSSGVGNSIVNFNIGANLGSARSCTITVGEQNFTVNQAAYIAPCSNSPSSPNTLSTGYIHSNEVGLSWAGTSVNVTNFEVERSISNTNTFTLIGSVDGTTFNYFDNTGVPGTTYDYRVRACCNSNCSSYSNVASGTPCTWHITPTAVIASASTICSGQGISFAVEGGALGTGDSWVWGNATNSNLGSGSTITLTPTTSGIYFVKAIGSTCPQPVSIAKSINITINPQPTSSTISANSTTTFCTGGSVTLSGNNGGTWSSGQTTASITANTSGDYFITNTNSCGSATSNHIVVNVNSIPQAPNSITGITTITTGSNTSLTATGCAETVKWYDLATNGTLLSTANPLNVTPTATTNYYSVCSINSCESVTRTMATVTVNPCIDNPILPDYITAGTYIVKAPNSITAINRAYSGTNVTYQAGSFIDLKSGFRADSGSVFKVMIGGCSN